MRIIADRAVEIAAYYSELTSIQMEAFKAAPDTIAEVVRSHRTIARGNMCPTVSRSRRYYSERSVGHLQPAPTFYRTPRLD